MNYESGKYSAELHHVKRVFPKGWSFFQRLGERGVHVIDGSDELKHKRFYETYTGVDESFSFVTRPSSSPVTSAVAEQRVKDVYKEGKTVSGLMHAEVVELRLNGHDQDVLMEMVWSEISESTFSVSIRYSQGMTPLKPGVKAKRELIWHSNERSFIDGRMTTVSRLLFPGAIPLPFAWPDFEAPGPSNWVFPPASRRFVPKAIERYMRKGPRRRETEEPEPDIPHEICSWMFSPDVQKRNRVWREYNQMLNRPHVALLNEWFGI